MNNCDGCVFKDDVTLTMCSICNGKEHYVTEEMSILAGISEEAVQELCDIIYATGFRPTGSVGSLLEFNSYTDYLEAQNDLFKDLIVKVIKLKVGLGDKAVNSIVDLIVATVKKHFKIEEEE